MAISPVSAAGPGAPQRSSRSEGGSYASQLSARFGCVRNGKVTISGAYLGARASDPARAAQLESDLSHYKTSVAQGRQSAQANAASQGARLVSYDETWSVDKDGNITMMASTTITSDTGAKSTREALSERMAKRSEKREAERAEAQKEAMEAQKEQLRESLRDRPARPGAVDIRA